MAYVDDGRYTQEASDEAFTHECGPCNSESKTKEARHYCTTCSEYICDDCVAFHRKFKEMRDHEIVSAPEVSKHVSIKPKAVSEVKCDCNQNFVEFVCEDHNDVVCGACQTVKHRKCTTVLIQDKCLMADYIGYQPGRVLKKVKSLQNDIDALRLTSEAEIRSVNTMTDNCSAQIKTFRNQLNSLFDIKEQKLMKDINAFASEHKQIIDHHVSSLVTTYQMLEADRKTLENFESNGSREALFATDIKVSKPLIEYETVVLDIEKEFKKYLLIFELNMQLEDSLKEKPLGNLKIWEANLKVRAKDVIHPVVAGMKVTSSSRTNVKLSDDEETPDITGCAFLPNGMLLLADWANKKVKLLDSLFVVKDSLVLSSRPWDITALDDDTAIVTLPDEHELQYIHMSPKLEQGRTVSVDGESNSVAIVENELFVACRKWDKGDIRVLDEDASEKKRIDVVKKRMFGTQTRIFKWPRYMTSNMSQSKIFVSDFETKMITCLTASGSIIYQYKDATMKRPCALYVDAEDNLLVCDYYESKVQVITAHGKKDKTLLRSDAGLDYPQSIALRPIDATCIVGCAGSENLLIFELS